MKAKKWKSMTFQEKIDFKEISAEEMRQFWVRKSIRDLQDMENKEEQFEIAIKIGERLQNPPLSKKEWEIICELCVPGFEEILFPKKMIFVISPHKMNPHEVNQQNLITKNPIKNQIKGRTDITVPFRIKKDDHEEKALIQFEGQMKDFERDGIFSLGISVPQHLECDKKKHPERNPVEHLEKVIQQKANSAKPEIQKLPPKIKFQSQDFQLIKDGEF